MNEFEPYIPSERVVKHCEFILSNVDEDIANEFRNFGIGTYESDSPLLVQIARNLREIICAMRSSLVINISNASQGDNEGDDD